MQNTPNNKYTGVFTLVTINIVIFILMKLFSNELSFLFLNTSDVRWYQLLTSIFCHLEYSHLSGNLFFLYIFGRLIEEQEGTMGVVVSYLICGIGANLFTLVLNFHSGYYIGASGAIFGLFTISMLIKFKPRFTNIIEIFILTPFVLGYIITELKSLNNSDNISHESHIYGSIVGVLLIIGLRYLRGKYQ